MLIEPLSSTKFQLKPCKSSSECGQNSCCRDVRGVLVGRLNDGGSGFGFGGFGDLLLGVSPTPSATGFCSTNLQQKGERCDPSSCTCGSGLTCYRPISGACCPPHQCYDSEWVKKQEKYWRECFSNPSCPLPP
ncbi:uncharacterized protein LOC106177958 [Lingula anatina]|uniref:Uncharacterized protein LOC106177958 n=1 Tax=Lingula anatina TaxID=7574 RepID=A0A1S3K162_LINAN|nr:uncharacterized protein LOC106177958 [Lingula anatina]|eukprot:XP_013416373.1 uncharacterized protein LOC106177958 [Lingula anatina]